MTEQKYPPIGSVSSGTHRPEDLIPAFMAIVEEYSPERYAELVKPENYGPVMLHLDAFEDLYEATDAYPDAQEQAGYLLDALYDELDAIAAPYTYFGAIEGDGADFGYWPAIEQLEEDARHDPDVMKHDNTPSYLMHVSDHGNVTLYAVEYRELWSVV